MLEIENNAHCICVSCFTQISHSGLWIQKLEANFNSVKFDLRTENKFDTFKSWWAADAAAMIIFHPCLAQACNSLYLKTVQQKQRILGLNLKDSFNTSLLSWLSCAAPQH